MPASVTKSRVRLSLLSPEIQDRLTNLPPGCQVAVLPAHARKKGDLLNPGTRKVIALLEEKGVSVYPAFQEPAVESGNRDTELLLPVLLFLAKSTASIVLEIIARWLYDKYAGGKKEKVRVTYEHWIKENDQELMRKKISGTAEEVAEALVQSEG